MLTIESLKSIFATKVYDFYKQYKTITKDYTISAEDIFTFDQLNSFIIIVMQLRDATLRELGANSETFRIVEFLSRYFSYFKD